MYPTLHPSSVPFITYHEVAHKIIPHHSILTNPHLDDDLSLDPEFAKDLEIEANIGAALILFQVDRFAKEIRDVPLGWASAMYFAERYEASLHSAFRHFTEMNHCPCAMLVLYNQNKYFDRLSFGLKYSICSKEFKDQFRTLDWGTFYEGHPIYDTIVGQEGETIRKGK